MPEHINSLQWRKKKNCDLQKVCVRQCCGAGGAEIIGGPGAGAENKFKYTVHFLQSVGRMLGRRKASFYLY